MTGSAKATYRVSGEGDGFGMQVVVDGVVYRPGDTFTADTREARKWARNGLVVQVDGPADPDADRPAQLGAGFGAAHAGETLTTADVEQLAAGTAGSDDYGESRRGGRRGGKGRA